MHAGAVAGIRGHPSRLLPVVPADGAGAALCQMYWLADAVFVGYVTEAVGVGWPPNVAGWSEWSKLTARLTAEGVMGEGLASLESRPPTMTYTDVHGRYRFVSVPAGRYYAVVSVPAGEGESRTCRRTFHPNAASLAGASAVTLAEGQKKTDADVQLPPP